MSGASWKRARRQSNAALAMVSVNSRGPVFDSRTVKVYSRTRERTSYPTNWMMRLSLIE